MDVLTLFIKETSYAKRNGCDLDRLSLSMTEEGNDAEHLVKEFSFTSIGVSICH